MGVSIRLVGQGPQGHVFRELRQMASQPLGHQLASALLHACRKTLGQEIVAFQF